MAAAGDAPRGTASPLTATVAGATAVAVIPARLASSRLPGKVLADLGGRPMLWWTWRACVAAGVDRVLVASGDAEVLAAARAFGAETVHTGPAASGTDRVASAATALDAAFVVGVQADEPFLAPAVVAGVVQGLRATGADLVTAMCPASPGDDVDPDVVTCAADPDGRALWFARDRASPHRHVGIYGWRRAALGRFAGLPPHPDELRHRLEQLRAMRAGFDVRLVPVGPQRPGIDTPADLAAARTWLRAREKAGASAAAG